MFKFLWLLLADLRPKFVLLFLGLCILQFYELVPPFVAGEIVDFFTEYNQGQSLNKLVVLILGLGASHFVVAMIRVPGRMYLKALFSELVYRVKVNGFQRLIDFSLTWHEQENSGNKVQRLQHGTAALENLGKSMASGGGITVAVLRVVMVVAAFVFLNPLALMFAITYVCLFTFTHLTFARKAKELINDRNKKLELATGSFYEGLTNVLTLKSLGGKEAFTGRVSDAEAITRDYEIKVLRVRSNRVRFFHVWITLGLISFLGLVSWQFIKGEISLGDILVYYTFFNRLVENSWELMDLFDELQNIKLGLARMVPIFSTNEFANTGEQKFPTDWGRITINDGSFAYKEGEKQFILKDINLEINKGEIIGIAGKSGSGKSTLVRLLIGLYKLRKGKFLVGKANFYGISHESVTDNIAIVLQESELFNMSLKDNITLLAPDDSVKLAKAIKIAQLDSVIAKLPNGLETLIGEKGYRISGGERQRLGIARALFKNSDLLIFDEATSNLDTKTEAALQHALETELKNKTMIIIAHRLSTLKNVDRIYVFDNGNIIETGTFKQLINDSKSKFAQLYNTQIRKKSDNTKD